MPTRSVFTRDDTFFGVCEALGEDFGFNPTWLRALFALGLFWDPLVMPIAYAGAGALVALSRLLVPDSGAVSAEVDDSSEVPPALNDEAQAWEELALAA